MFKKALALAVIVVLLVGLFVVPASAATVQKFYNFYDGELYSSDGAYDTYEIKVPAERCWIQVVQGGKTIARSPTSGKPVLTVGLHNLNPTPLSRYFYLVSIVSTIATI